nr:hypothetical protein [Jatrophihabitans telluris]
MPGPWLTALVCGSLAVALLCSTLILIDICGRGFRQQVPIMNWVWPVTALYLDPVAVWLPPLGRTSSPAWQREQGVGTAPTSPAGPRSRSGQPLRRRLHTRRRPRRVRYLLPRGNDCRQTLLGEYAGDCVLAVLLGLVRQFFAVTRCAA